MSLSKILSSDIFLNVSPIDVIKMASINSQWFEVVSGLRIWDDFHRLYKTIENDLYYNLHIYDKFVYQRKLISRLMTPEDKYYELRLSIACLIEDEFGMGYIAKYIKLPPVYYIIVHLMYKYIQIDLELPPIEFLTRHLIQQRRSLQDSITDGNFEEKVYLIPLLKKKDHLFCYVHSSLFNSRDLLYDKDFIIISTISLDHNIDEICEVSGSFNNTYNKFMSG